MPEDAWEVIVDKRAEGARKRVAKKQEEIDAVLIQQYQAKLQQEGRLREIKQLDRQVGRCHREIKQVDQTCTKK